MAEKISDEMIEYVGILAKLELSPNEEIISFLHAYLCLNFRAAAEPKPSTVALSSKFSPAPRG